MQWHVDPLAGNDGRQLELRRVGATPTAAVVVLRLAGAVLLLLLLLLLPGTVEVLREWLVAARLDELFVSVVGIGVVGVVVVVEAGGAREGRVGLEACRVAITRSGSSRAAQNISSSSILLIIIVDHVVDVSVVVVVVVVSC